MQISLAFLMFILSSCSSLSPSLREKTPEELFKNVCSIGENVQSANGTVWFRTQSTEVSGQYYADVLASPKELKVEITNLFGGSEAMIRVQDDHYEVERLGKISSSQGSWGGIPLQWASALFLGRIPCPSRPTRVYQGSEKDQLIAEAPEERFIYRLEEKNREIWPVALIWTKTGLEPVTFLFEDPEETSRSPQKWEASSARGLLKLRWRNRKSIFSPEKPHSKN